MVNEGDLAARSGRASRAAPVPSTRARSAAGADERLRLTPLLATLSLAADLGNGVPMETTLRICLLSSRLARRAGADAADVVAAYRVANPQATAGAILAFLGAG